MTPTHNEDEIEKSIIDALYGKRDDAYTVNMTKVNRLKQLVIQYEDTRERAGRIDEILVMRGVGDRVAAQSSPSFEELCTAYDNHLLKRAADLTHPNV